MGEHKRRARLKKFFRGKGGSKKRLEGGNGGVGGADPVRSNDNIYRGKSGFMNLPGEVPPLPRPPQSPPPGRIQKRQSASPGGIEIKYFDGGGGGIDRGHEEDGVSVITPVTGVPPESPQYGRGFGGGRAQYQLPSPLLPPGLDDDDDGDDGHAFLFEHSLPSGGGSSAKSPPRQRVHGVSAGLGNGASDPLFSRKKGEGVERKNLFPNNNMVSGILKNRTSWLTRTKLFKRTIDWAFDLVDADGSGDVDKQELYSGLLLIHLTLAAYAGPAGCRPASREYVMEIFEELDTNRSGTLEKDEFSLVIQILCSQVLTRVVMQWTLTLMIVPLISRSTTKYVSSAYGVLHELWKSAEDNLNPLERILLYLWSLLLFISPGWLLTLGGSVGWVARYVCRKLPSSVWKGMPALLLTMAQTSVMLPMALMSVEDFFRRTALGIAREERKRRELKK